jgi:hypothetical protein
MNRSTGVFKIVLITMLMHVAFGVCYAQQENALPPGPARLHGTLLVNGAPYENASIVFFFMRNGRAHHTIYKSSAQGRFTVYVFDDAQEPLVAFFILNKLRLIFEPIDYSPGTNYSQTFDIVGNKKVRLKSKKYRKHLKEIKL